MMRTCMAPLGWPFTMPRFALYNKIIGGIEFGGYFCVV